MSFESLPTWFFRGKRMGVVLALAGLLAGVPGRGAAVEPIVLWPMVEMQAVSPCAKVGFSFPDPLTDLPRQRADGGEIVGMNRMWVPVEAPDEPDGVGYRFPDHAVMEVTQRWSMRLPFTGLMVQFPTDFQTGGADMALYREADAGKQLVAHKSFSRVPNEYQAKILFPRQAPGTYRLRIRYLDGTIGVWTAPCGPDAAGYVFEADGKARPGWYLEFAWLDEAGNWRWQSDPGRHCRVSLGRFRNKPEEVAAAGFSFMFWVGNWNNGCFPYYPDWFYTMYPDITMRDAAGKPILSGILGTRKGWPSIDHPVIVAGTRRFIRAWVREVGDDPRLLYWALGGEALYPTYLLPNYGWADYSANAQAHFRAWLTHRYRDVGALNRAWGSAYEKFDSVAAPRERAVNRRFRDWIDYRFAAMAERMAWHWRAVRTEDRKRPILTSNHGNIFWGDAYAALGADFPQYADVSDGFEMGQILQGNDPGYLNLWYAAALAGLGKLGAPARLAYRYPDATARGGGRSYTPAAARRYCLEVFGSGWWHLGLIQFSGSLPDGEWGVKDTPAEAAIARVWADLKQARRRAVGSWPILPKIGLYLSRPRWIQRGWDPSWTTFHAWAIQHHYDHAVFWEQQLQAGEGEQYPVLVSIDNTLLDSAAIEPLIRYLDRGGHLIILGDFALSDADGKPFPAAARERLLRHAGVRRPAVDLAAAWAALPGLFDEIGVRPFCWLTSEDPASTPWNIEAFTLFDGCNVMTPLVNTGDKATVVHLQLDAALVPRPAAGYVWFDAVSGAKLPAAAGMVRVKIPAAGYRILEYRAHPDPEYVRRRLAELTEQTAARQAEGFEVAYALDLLARARRDGEKERPGKALGRLNRLAASGFVKVIQRRFDAGGALRVEAEVADVTGRPWIGATGVLRVMPVPNAFARMREGPPGRYTASLAADSLREYDYRKRRYRACSQPRRVVLLFRQGRMVGNLSWDG